MTISQTSVRSRRAPGKPGQLYDLSAREIDFTNSFPQAAQVSTITVGGTPTEDDAYTAAINGLDVTVTAGASPTVDTVAAALADAINNDPAIRASVSAESAAAVVTLTGLSPGVAFAATTTTSDLSIATTTDAAKAALIPFGRLCVRTGDTSQEAYENRLGRLPESGDTVIDDLAIGISIIAYDQEGVGYEANDRVAAIQKGRVWVEVAGDVGESDDAYVGTADGEKGMLFGATGSGRLKLKKSTCRFFKSRAADGLAVVECNFY